jgi:hypothetical protein
MKLIGVLSLGLLAMGCAAADAAGGEETDDMDLATSRLESITVTAGQDPFQLPPPPGGCLDFEQYTVDFLHKTLTGKGCLEGQAIAPNRALRDDELAKVRAKVKAVKEVPRPESCPFDIPFRGLSVTRNGVTREYAHEITACFGAVRAVKGETLLPLLRTVRDLVGPARAFEGTLESVVAIGGETTGQVLTTPAGTFELELDAKLANDFVAGQKARVIGIREDRAGVEIPVRRFLKVEDLLVCPTASQVNCMPVTTEKACIPQNREWIAAACGTSFLD